MWGRSSPGPDLPPPGGHLPNFPPGFGSGVLVTEITRPLPLFCCCYKYTCGCYTRSHIHLAVAPIYSSTQPVVENIPRFVPRNSVVNNIQTSCSVVARFNPSPLACNDISYLRMMPNESPLDTSEDPSVSNGSHRNANYCSFFAFSIVSYEGLMTDNLRTSSRCCWLTSLTWISICCFSPYILG